MLVLGRYDAGRLKLEAFNDFSSDKGINKHNRLTKWFRKTLKFEFLDTQTNQVQKTYLNRQSAIKWLRSKGVEVKSSVSNQDIRQHIINQVKRHQEEASAVRKLMKTLNFSSDSVKKNYRNIECEFQNSMNSPDIIVLTKDSTGKIGKSFRVFLEKDNVHVEEIGEKNHAFSVNLQGISLEKLSALIASHSGFELNNLLKQLQINNSLKRNFKDIEIEFITTENPDQLKAKVSMKEDGTEQHFHLILEEDYIHIKGIGNDEKHKTIPLKNASIIGISEDLYILTYKGSSNRDILWEKLIAQQKSTTIFGADNRTIMRFKPSKTADCIEIYQGFSKKIIFRMYLEGSTVIFKQVLENGESPVEELPLSVIDPDHIVKLLGNLNPIKNAEEPFNIKTMKFGISRKRRMLGSVYFKKNEILQKALELGLTPHDKKMSEFPSEKLDSLFDYFGISILERRFIEGSLTIFQLAKEIKKRKKAGLYYQEKYEGMQEALNYFVKSTEILDEDKELFKIFQDRLEEQFGLYFSTIEPLNTLTDEKSKNEMALKIAQYVLLKVDCSKYKEIGFFVNGGWSGDKYGHHINIEVRKIGDKFYFYLANAGAGVRYHGKVKGNRCVVIKIFEANAEDALEILKNIILLRTSPDVTNHSKKFYQIFKKAKTINNSYIPSRPLQTGGNCGVRNQEECWFYACQRLEKVEAANNFLKSLQKMLIEGDAEPFFKKKLQEKGPKEPVKPFLKRRKIFLKP